MIIEIWSDIACPYCYIGKRKLDMALSKFENGKNIELVWHSYELDPSLPKKATKESYYEYFASKFNKTVEEARKRQEGVVELAKEVGLEYNFEKLVVANTSDALRLVKLAAESNLATEAEEVIFKAYFEQGKDVSNKATLIELGSEIGLEAEAIEAMLDSDKFYDEIAEDIEYADKELELEYIPFYRLNNSQIIQGSIDAEDYLKIIEKAYSDWEKGLSSDEDIITGQSCSLDGVCG